MPRSSSVRPIEEFADVLRIFMRSDTVRALAALVDPRLKGAALQTIRGFEYHADNRGPVVVVELSGETNDESAWAAAVDSLREAHEVCREGGAPLASLDARPLGSEGAANFSAQVLQGLHSVEAPAEGMLLVVVAWGTIDRQWVARLADMAGSDTLAALRWMFVTGPDADVAPWTAVFPKGVAIQHRVAMDEARAVAEISAELDVQEARGPGLRGAGPKGVRPPPRPRAWRAPPLSSPTDSPPRPDPEGGSVVALVPTPDDAGASDVADAQAEPVPGGAQPMLLVQRAALAMRSGDGPEAIVHQAAARDASLEAGELRDAVSMELMLGAYLLDLGQPRLAGEAFGRAGTRALEIDAGDLAAEAYTAQGSAAEQDADPVAALQAYRHGIETAQQAERPVLALQAYWLAGKVALGLALDLDCIGLWADAVVYANGVDPEQRSGSRAAAIAEHLGTLLIEHRRFSEAREIERLAAGF